MLSKNNTPSATAFAEQRCRKADSRTESRQSDKAHRTGQRRILASDRKKQIDFSGGSAVDRLPILFVFQKISLSKMIINSI